MKRSPVYAWVAQKTGLGAQLDPNTLREYQFSRLRETLDFVKRHSRHYADTLQHLDPRSVMEPQDLHRLPFTTAEDLHMDSARFVCVPQHKVARIVTLSTSGTSGNPKRLYFSEHDLELCVDFFACGMQTMVSKGDSVAVFLGGTNPGGTVDLLRQALERIGVEAILRGFLDDAAKPLECFQADCLVGLPTQLFQVAKANPTLRPKAVLLCADYVSDAVYTRIRDTWHCEVFTHYGSTESGLGGGVQCWAHNGYHVRDADLLIEIIDPNSGRPVPRGSFGEVVFSTLTREAMPLIRYRTGDISRILDTPCPCGSPLHRLDTIAGRYANLIPLACGGVLSIHQLDDMLFGFPEILGYSAELHSGRDLRITARLSEAVEPGQLARRIEELLMLPLSVSVSITEAPLPASHAKRIISVVNDREKTENGQITV